MTEREILLAAEKTIADRGLDGLSMGDVAAQAGVAVGTIYNYFRDRDALVGALFAERRVAFAAALADDAGRCAGRPFAEQTACFICAAFTEFDAHLAFFSSALESEAWRNHAPADDARVSRRVMQQMEDRAVELVRLGLGEGALRADRATHHAAVLFGIMKSIFAQRLRARETTPVEQVAELILDVFLTGCGRRA